MSQAQGYNSYFGWKEQVAFATAATPPNKWIIAEAIPAPEMDRKPIHKAYLGNVSRKHTIRGQHSPSISGLKFPFLTDGIEQLLEHALGSVSTGAPSGGIYPHTFSLASALPAVGLTGYVDIDDGEITGDHVQQIIGMMIDKLTITQEDGEPMSVEIDVVGREYVDVARTSPTLPTFSPFDYSMMTVAAISPAGDNIVLPATKLKIEINNNLFKEKRTLTSAGKRTGFPRAGQRSVMIEFEVFYEDHEVMDYVKDGSSFDLDFRWVSGSKSIVLTTLAGKFQGNRPGASDSGPVKFTAQYDALSYSADNDELSLVLSNETSSV